MIKRIVPIALLGAVFFSFGACKNSNKTHKLAGGLEYKIVKDKGDKKDKKPAIGDVLELHIKLKVDDSLLADSRKENNNQPVPVMIQQSQYAGDWTNALTNLTVGDSAVITMSIDSLKSAMTAKGGMLPPFFEGKKKLVYEVVVVNIKNQQQLQQEQQKMMQEQQAQASQQQSVDDKILQDYFAKNNIKPMKTPSGVYYTLSKEGSGPTPKPGQAVSVNYTGHVLNGEVFDSNIDPKFQHVEPFTFGLGQNQVIPGWDEGVSMMKKGSKGTLYIPSPLAYGANPQPGGPIPPNAILVFDIEVLDIKEGGAQPQMQVQ